MAFSTPAEGMVLLLSSPFVPVSSADRHDAFTAGLTAGVVDAASASPIDSGWSAGTGERHWCMASARRKSAVLGIIVGAMLAIGAPAVAWAEDPVEFGSSPVVDTVGALGGRLDEVEAAIDETADANGRQLFVAYVDEFTNPEAADAWANDTAIANNMGAEDYLLAVAIDGRAYYLSADSEASVSDADLQRIMLEVIEPQLRDGNWAQAAIDTADALGDGGGAAEAGAAAGAGSGSSSSAAVVVAIIAIILSRRRSRKQAGAGGAAAPRPGLPRPRSRSSVGRRAAHSCRPTTR